MFDPRDCKPYRVMLMPDNRWWFAQDLRWGGNRVGSCSTAGCLYRWSEAVTGREVPDDTYVLLTINSDTVGPKGACPEGWHLPTGAEWHRLGASMGSGAATPTDDWQPSALHQLISFRWAERTDVYNAGRKMRQGNDAAGFSWMPTPFTGLRGVNKGSVWHGALWSAGSMAEDPQALTISRVVAQTTADAWAANPLTDDNHAGHKAKDFLPVRCIIGAGVAAGVGDMVPMADICETEAGLIGCPGAITNAGSIGA
jgi:uncharacterized protein (TIGR02145 family)